MYSGAAHIWGAHLAVHQKIEVRTCSSRHATRQCLSTALGIIGRRRPMSVTMEESMNDMPLARE